MLDIHAMTVTPGAAAVLGNPGAIAVGDPASVAGVPISDTAKLIMWGLLAPTADTINHVKLASQDMIDPINGEDISLGASSVLTEFHKHDQLQYKTGARLITAGTNTGVVAGTAFTIDHYPGGPVADLGKASPQIVIPPITTFGGALTTNQWGNQAFAPATMIPNGKYAILGAYARAFTNNGLVAFRHKDFGSFIPGFPVATEELALATAVQISTRDRLMLEQGFQFVTLSQRLKTPCCPVFNVTNASTGLQIYALSVQADTPIVNLNLAKIG